MLVTLSRSDFESLAGTKNKSKHIMSISPFASLIIAKSSTVCGSVEPVPQQRVVPHAKIDTQKSDPICSDVSAKTTNY